MTRPAMYSRPAKPLTIPVQRRRGLGEAPTLEAPELITVDAATECHVTPADVARRMVDYLGPVGDFMTLEPSAGTGQLIRALLVSGHSPYELCAVERHVKLFNGLYRVPGISGAGLVNSCFLEWAEKAKGRVAFPRVIMNPPFRKVRAHVKAAQSLLGRGGHNMPAVLVALVPVTFESSGFECLEHLPDDTFSTAKVATKIVRFEK